jgi:ADP-ribosylglycohydrolase
MNAIQNLKVGLMPPFSGQHNHAWSDGLAMRVAPIGVIANGDIEMAKRIAIADGEVSHSGEGIYSGIAIAVAVTSGMAGKSYLEVYSDALNSVPKDSWTYRTLVDAQNILNENASATLFENAERLLEKVAQTKYFFADLAPEAVSLALASVLYGKGDFAKSLLFAVNLGRDADTIAAMAGAVAGSISGYKNIPDKWKVAVTSVGGSCLAFTKGMEPLSIADSLVEMGSK